MTAVIFADSPARYTQLRDLIQEAASQIQVLPEITEEAYRMADRVGCDIEVVAINGARGMEIVLDHRGREKLKQSKLIWITDDAYFAGAAIREEVFCFILCPFSKDAFGKAIRRAIQMEELEENSMPPID